MATRKKTPQKENTIEDIASGIVETYKEYLLIHGKKPNSVFEFCNSIKVTETEFYYHFSSFDVLEKSIWTGFLLTTLETLKASGEYAAYPVKEKLLSFYFTLVEVLKKNRSFILLMSDKGFDMLRKNVLDKSHKIFVEYIDELVKEGIESGDVMKRPWLSDKYGEAFWLQLLFVVNFWIKDDSAGFEKTDAAIEKAVKLSFDLVGPGAVDSFFDMAKFIFQNK